MSITDELRKWGRATLADTSLLVRMEAIADRIDAEHERAMSRAGQLLADAEKDRDYNYANWQECRQKVLQGNITFGELNAKIEHLMDELSHCIELPKDADGVPFHIGELVDEMLPFGGYAAPAPIDTMELSRGASGYVWMVKLDAENRALISPKLLRHHAPTVEDVLTEFGIDWEYESDCEDRAALLKEYASKLRLAEGED